ncbi:MAG: Rossmann-like and DUF2520 domain-containing protein [Desulfobacterales bacterium]
MKPAFSIVGCGRMGCTLAAALAAAGYPPAGFFSRSPASARMAVDAAGGGTAYISAVDACAGAGLVFLTPPDDVIESVCDAITGGLGFPRGAIVLHCSGSQPSSILASARRSGCSVGSLHPLKSIASRGGVEDPFRGAVFSVEGDPAAVSVGTRIAGDLNATAIPIRTEDKVLYHAAAVVASNYLVTLLDQAYRLLETVGLPPRETVRALSPLIRGTLTNVEHTGAELALTGPVARGDVETVRSHVTALARQMPGTLPVYRALGLCTVDLAVRSGKLPDKYAAALRSVLAEPAADRE